MILNTLRISFYSMLMISLHMSDNGAGVNRALRDIQDSHYRHTGAL